MNSHLKSHHRSYHTKEGQSEHKREEQKVAKMLDANGFKYKREHTIDMRCAGGEGDGLAVRARGDFLLEFGATVLILEVDEFQHSGYGVSCDVERMCRIIEALRIEGCELRIAFVRYNPHAFKVDGHVRRVRTTKRLERLAELLRKLQSETLDPKLMGDVRTYYMFYDADKVGRPTIFGDEMYSDLAKQWFVKNYIDKTGF